MICLWCNKDIIIQINWKNFIVPTQQQSLCLECASLLYKLTGTRCERCSRETKTNICKDCGYWKNSGIDSLERNYSIFSYNDSMKEMVARWKYRGDYILGKVFEQEFKNAFKKEFADFSNSTIIPIPLSHERMQERRFNQAKMLAEFIDGPSISTNTLARIHSEKQSKRSRIERIQATNPFVIKNPLNKSVILVDDIYTTGTTLKFAADVLKESGCSKVYSLTLVRG